MEMKKRQDWDTTWMAVALCVAERSRCTRAKVGAVIVTKKNRVIATGYNGPPAGLATGDEACTSLCPRAWSLQPGPTYEDCVSIHAEANALLFCDRQARQGGTCYITGDVCYECSKLLANSGLKRVVIHEDGSMHRDPEKGIELMRQSGLQVDVH